MNKHSMYASFGPNGLSMRHGQPPLLRPLFRHIGRRIRRRVRSLL